MSKNNVPSTFESFRDHLDDHNDRRERLIKASRDITNLSKKVIFLLHRVLTQNTVDGHKEATQRAHPKLREIQASFARIKDELGGDRFWRYHKQISPGLQEYIEALGFAHYLETGTLISISDVQRSLSDEQGVPYLPLPIADYLLGLADVMGELMRFAISGIARRGGRKKATDVCAFVRRCRSDFERLTPYIHDLSKKQSVTTQSLEKIEDATYALVVRNSEYDLPPELLDDMVARIVSSYDTTAMSRSWDGYEDRSEEFKEDGVQA